MHFASSMPSSAMKVANRPRSASGLQLQSPTFRQLSIKKKERCDKELGAKFLQFQSTLFFLSVLLHSCEHPSKEQLSPNHNNMPSLCALPVVLLRTSATMQALARCVPISWICKRSSFRPTGVTSSAGAAQHTGRDSAIPRMSRLNTPPQKAFN